MRMTGRRFASEPQLKPVSQIRFDAIGTSGNDQSFYSGKAQRLLIEPYQSVSQTVCVGKRLEIGQIPVALTLPVVKPHAFFKLCGYGACGIVCSIRRIE